MKMIAFQVANYRCINDSGWIDVNDITAIVGKNESGKTSLLKALWKFKPFKPEPYSLDREWPRGKRQERTEDAPVVTVRFEFTPDERKQIEAIDESAFGITGVEITRNYKGSYLYKFLPQDPSRVHNLKWVISVLQENFGQPPEKTSDHFKSQYKQATEIFITQIRENGGSEFAVKESQNFKNRLPQFVSPDGNQQPQDNQSIQELNKSIDKAVKELGINPPVRRAIDTAHEWLPVFIYMDDYRIFNGSAHLDQVKQRKDRNQLLEEDRTVISIMEMAGLDLDKEFQKGGQQDREQRILDMNDASQTLTNLIADRWTQKKYEVMFQADGHHFITFVKDVDGKILVPLEERSKGFQWFFSFDMMFMYQTDGEFKNAIILLDEPGLHLHAAAQKDLLKRMKAYTQNNQLIYTTHLPFMIDFTRLDNICIAEDRGKDGVKVHKDWAVADKDARFTLQAALGLAWSQSLFVGQYNLVVEGVTDFWYLTTVSSLLKDAGQKGIDDDLVITPSGGASKVAYIGTILHGQKLNVAVLLDSDQEGKTAYEQLVHQWILDEKHALLIGRILGIAHSCALEDLFSEEYYLFHVAAAYKSELDDKPIVLSDRTGAPIVERVEKALKERGIEQFNKGRVAKRIMRDLANKSIADLPVETVDNFKKVFATINDVVATWKNVS